MKDSRIASLAEKVKVVKDPSLPRGVSCRMVIMTADDKTYSAQVDYPKGSVQNPMTDAELTAKFCTLASTCLKREQMDEIVQRIDELEKLESMAHLMKLVS